MRREVAALLLVGLGLFGLGLAGCGDGPLCGPGTVESGGTCVPADGTPTCGEGTVLSDGQCLPDPDAVTDGVALDGGAVDTQASDTANPDTQVADTQAVDTLFGDALLSDGQGGDSQSSDVVDGGVGDSSLEDGGVEDGGLGDAVDAAPSCTVTCADDEICVDGQCVPAPPPAGWTCGAQAWADGQTCDCACGAPDPDCADAKLVVKGCLSGVCKEDGTCAACVAECAGKACGPDGCGGLCGTCSDPSAPVCEAGQCVACKPQCGYKQCGPDGCGGSCGSCAFGTFCQLGQCAPAPVSASCKGLCGAKAPSGCACTADCTAKGTCCLDFSLVCGCVPQCTGKVCGDNGCGGSCGQCKVGDKCSAGQCIDDLCSPDPCSGHGTCAPATGTCTCGPQYAGKNCELCAPGRVNYPQCYPDPCKATAKPCSGHGTCSPLDGSCTCAPGFSGPTCGACVVAGKTFPACPNPCAGVDCDDANPCTDDQCIGDGVCVHLANAATCTDGDPCTEGDHCSGGSCKAKSQLCDVVVTADDDTDDGTCDAAHCSLREAIATANADKGATRIGFAGPMTVALTKPLPALTAPATVDGLAQLVVLDGGHKVPLLRATAALTVRRITLRKGRNTSGPGGAIDVTGGALTLQDAVLEANLADKQGAAVRAHGGGLVERCRFEGNSHLNNNNQAGGALALYGQATVRESVFVKNLSAGPGGAIVVNAGATATVTRSAFVQNTATSAGGGIANYGSLTLRNSSLVKNKANTMSGGGLWSQGTATVVHCSFAEHSVKSGGRDVHTEGALTLHNSLLASTASGAAACASKKLQAATGSLVVDGSCSAPHKGDPGLAGLGAWRGAVPSLGLKAGSAAVGKADDAICATLSVDHPTGGAGAVAVDQTGFPRPFGQGCDIGAFELAELPCAGPSGQATCTDGDACTEGDACDSGSCKAGKPLGCDDGNSCTTDSCDSWQGCRHGAAIGACSDGDACTDKDRCSGGQCVAGPALDCDDGNACTADSCGAKSGCSHKPQAGDCDDGQLCTTGESCKAGQCVAAKSYCTLPVIADLAGRWSAAAPASISTNLQGRVTEWRDLSGKGRHLVPHGKAPIVDKQGLLGAPAMDFGGAAGLVTSAFPLTKEITFFVVVRYDVPNGWGTVAHHGNRDWDWSLEHSGFDPKTVLHFQSGNDNGGVEQSFKTGSAYLITGRIKGNTREFSVTGAATKTVTGNGNTIKPGSKKLYLGRSDVGEASNIAIGEILYFSRALSDAERDQVQTYLRVAWQLPTQVPDFGWWDAADPKSLTVDGGGKVSKWLDKSGLGRHATAAGNQRPTLTQQITPSKGAALSFPSSPVRLQTQAVPTSPQMTIFALLRYDKPANWGSVFNQAHDKYFSIRKSDCCGGGGKLNWHIGNNNAAPLLPLAIGEWKLLTTVQDATTSSMKYHDGASASTKQGPIATGSAPLTIGAAVNGNESMGGHVAEIRAYGKALPATERAVIEAALRRKWGL